MKTVIIWTKLVVTEKPPFKSYRKVYQLEPTWPGEKAYRLVDIPDDWLFGRNARGDWFVTPPGGRPMSLKELSTKTRWEQGSDDGTEGRRTGEAEESEH
jgi:hypothetical protein